jgi:acetylornithine deacetylase/succinyl-diaminopimelate desuccinylase family protein
MDTEPSIVAFTQKMVSVASENPPGRAYRECAEALAQELSALGIGHRIYESWGQPSTTQEAGGPPAHLTPGMHPRYCLLGEYGAGGPLLYFHGHYDVVPAVTPDQFEARRDGNRIWGRGSADMKGGLAAMLGAIRILETTGVRLGGRIGIVLVPDEETAGQAGTPYLMRKGLIDHRALGMFMPECTSGTAWNANRGAISLLIRVKGRPAHVGLHFQGTNAFERMTEVARRLLLLGQEIGSRKTDYRMTPEAARHSILLVGGRVEGGTNFNLVPGECSFTVDRRINPEESLHVEKQRLMDLFDEARQRGIDLDVEMLQEGEASGTSERHPVAAVLSDCVEAVMGEPPRFEMCPGLCEIRYYASLGIPAFAYGPGLLDVAHGPAEYVDVDEMCSSAAIYALVALRLLGQDLTTHGDH